MPTIHYEKGYRFYFNSNENKEPPHVHIKGEKGRMKVWLLALNIANCRGIPDHTQTRLLEIVETNQKKFLREWKEFKQREVEK